MQLNIRSVLSIVLLVATTSLTACGANIDPDESAEQPRSTSAMLEAGQEAAGRAAGQELARAMARSLREPAMRGLVRAALAQSLVKEEKVHFNSYVRGPGRALLQSMSRQSGRSEAGLEELLAQAGSLEMYFPVKEHRAAWRGGEDLLVATAYRDHEAPLGFNLAGNPVTLSAKEPPATATLVLVPAEDFTADGTPTGRGLSLGRGGQRTQVSQELSTTTTDMRGVYVKYVQIPGDYEGWPRGEPEYEFYLERFQGGRQQLRCAGAGSPSPFQWNMDGKTWSTPFLIGWEDGLPSDAGFAMFLYEDDDIPCVVNDDKDYVKLTLDALKANNSADTALQKRQSNKPLISFSHGMVESKSINSGGDEYVGTVSSAGQPIDTAERDFTVTNQHLQPTATVKLQWRTFLSSIAITPATASVPEGRTQQFTATGTYRDGTTRDLTDSVTWTSSDSSIATVDSAGLVTGLAAGGTVTLTATQDSVSGSAQLTVTPAVVISLTVTPATASINVGATQQFTATGTLSNNTTADLTSSVTWTSSNTAAVTVDASGLASGITAGPATIMATHSGVSGTASLSVECPSPSAMCSESCVHLPTDPNNCGACGNVCAQGEGCANSLCVNTGNLGISLSWDRPGDGDLHVVTSTGKLINHKNKGPSASTDYGQLDRDDATGTGPENIYWASGFTPPSGTYHVCGHPYSFGGTAPVTFTAMIRVPGQPTITLTKTLNISASAMCAPGSESYMGSFSYP